MNALGYRWATIGEVSMAKEAATPGTINEFAANNQVKPRNLPGKVNEYGFDVGDHGNRAWWVVKANGVNMPTFNQSPLNQKINNDLYSSNSGENNLFFGRNVSIFGNQIIVSPGKAISYSNNSAQGATPIHFVTGSSGISFSQMTTRNGSPRGFGVASSIEKGEVAKPVSYNNGILAVGSSNEGAVYLYSLPSQNNNSQVIAQSSQVAKITPTQGESDEGFGATVALFDKILIVGAPWSNSNGYEDSGCVLMYLKLTTISPGHKFPKFQTLRVKGWILLD